MAQAAGGDGHELVDRADLGSGPAHPEVEAHAVGGGEVDGAVVALGPVAPLRRLVRVEAVAQVVDAQLPQARHHLRPVSVGGVVINCVSDHAYRVTEGRGAFRRNGCRRRPPAPRSAGACSGDHSCKCGEYSHMGPIVRSECHLETPRRQAGPLPGCKVPPVSSSLFAMAGLALVHDYLLVLRGAERTFAAMTDVWPDAPIVTLLYDEDGTQGRFAGRDITTSRLQRLGVQPVQLPRTAPAVSHRRRAGSRSGATTASSRAAAPSPTACTSRAGAIHVCYCHSPFRYAWHEQPMALSEVSKPLRPLLRLFLRRHRSFDLRSAAGVDQYIANGLITQERIKRYWARDAPIVYPPVDVERFSIGEAGDHVLFVGELVRHKRPDLAIEAAAEAGRWIKVVGTGPELGPLKERYAGKAEFLGRVDDVELGRLYSRPPRWWCRTSRSSALWPWRPRRPAARWWGSTGRRERDGDRRGHGHAGARRRQERSCTRAAERLHPLRPPPDLGPRPGLLPRGVPDAGFARSWRTCRSGPSRHVTPVSRPETSVRAVAHERPANP